MKVYGYARVSTKEQNTIRQYSALIEAGVPKQNIFTDKESGRTFERVAYNKLMKRLKHGDLLVMTHIDRLGRNYKAVLQQWYHITLGIGAKIKVLDTPLLDTTVIKDDLYGLLICDLILCLNSFTAENTLINIKANQRQGIEKAKQAGKHLGRPRLERSQLFESTYAMWKDGKITATMAMQRLGLKKTTFYRMVKEFDERGE